MHFPGILTTERAYLRATKVSPGHQKTATPELAQLYPGKVLGFAPGFFLVLQHPDSSRSAGDAIKMAVKAVDLPDTHVSGANASAGFVPSEQNPDPLTW
jgi:hypothetical protein